MIPKDDDCPQCGTPMERGITEYGQICPSCLHYEDDTHWAMEGEYFDENGDAIPNPRQPHPFRPFTTRDGSQACAVCEAPPSDPIHSASVDQTDARDVRGEGA